VQAVLQPLFCYSPEVMISRQMDDNYVDFNAAKLLALRSIVDAPIWPGAPKASLRDGGRVQSSASRRFMLPWPPCWAWTRFSIASSDEAYSGGPSPWRQGRYAARHGGGLPFLRPYQAGVQRERKIWADELVGRH
jgi:hypothetical protein